MGILDVVFLHDVAFAVDQALFAAGAEGIPGVVAGDVCYVDVAEAGGQGLVSGLLQGGGQAGQSHDRHWLLSVI